MKLVVGDRVKVRSGLYKGLDGVVIKLESHLVKSRGGIKLKKLSHTVHVRTRNDRLLKVRSVVLRKIT